MRRIAAVAAAMWVALSPPVAGADPPLSQVPAEPQRPAKSRSAAPAPEGTVQLETGVSLDPDDLGTDLTFRFGLTRIWDISIEGVPYVRVDVDGVGGIVISMTGH